jgi:hypothetical protein
LPCLQHRERQGLRLSRGQVSGVSRAVVTHAFIGAQLDVPAPSRLLEAKQT